MALFYVRWERSSSTTIDISGVMGINRPSSDLLMSN